MTRVVIPMQIHGTVFKHVSNTMFHTSYISTEL